MAGSSVRTAEAARTGEPTPKLKRALRTTCRGHYRNRGACCTALFATDQAWRLGGSRRFDDRQGYEAFVEQIVSRMNARVFRRLAVEQPMLKLLPVRRTAEYEELPARVSKYAIFRGKSEQYSALSQLIGRRLMVRRTSKHIECRLGGQRALRRDRAVRREGWRNARDIDCRHLVAALRRKLGAFAHGVLRDAAFSSSVCKKTWERLHAATTERKACETMVGLQVLAADGHEARPADGLEQLVELNQLPDLQALTELRVPAKGEVPTVTVASSPQAQGPHG
jgi:hypothetical protein